MPRNMAVNGFAYTPQSRPFFKYYDTVGIIINGLILLVINSATVYHNKAQEISINVNQNDTRYICPSMDIRNSLEAFAKLEKCEVIEGFLQILLFDNVNETALMNIQFPRLTEITDYFLLYRVIGLRSIGHIFPNLSVIRGQNRFLENTFIIFEMSTLEEIGLYSLTDIMHGSVRIDKNPLLCFIHTIDWSHIVHDKSEKNIIKSLIAEIECPTCPGDPREINNKNNSLSCPKASRIKSEILEKNKYLCWNKNHCQTVCPSNCTACDDEGRCCDRKCLACKKDNPRRCTVCLNYTFGIGEDKKCVEICPNGFYGYLDRRCISKEECIRMPRPIEFQTTTVVPFPYRIFQNSCILHCPAGFMDDNENNTCVPCGGRCTKICDGINIDSILTAKQLRGCTHIKGSLEIQIKGGSKVVTELEENLNMIEEISGYIKVIRSFSMMSLNFLKSLKRIKGEKLESKCYAFVVLDNQNLLELWDWKNRTIQIDNGRLFFHFNPKLCLDKIVKLQKMAHLMDLNDTEVATISNGDKSACNIFPLQVNVTHIKNKSVQLEWTPLKLEDPRRLLAYIVYYIEAVYRNVTLYDGRDACGMDDWLVLDKVDRDDGVIVTQLLTNLKPYTQYAFYVKTYTIASEKNGSQSEVQYFRTLPSMPSSPQDLHIESNSSESLKITWAPPAHPNGDITHYIVSGKKHFNGFLDSEDRDYCKHPKKLATKNNLNALITPTPNNNDCQYEGNVHKKSIDEEEENARIKFEDELHNQVYLRRPMAAERKKRETTGAIQIFSNNSDIVLPNIKYNEIQNLTENSTDTWKSFNFTVYGRELYIDNLYHFTYYEINVQACRKHEGEEDTESACSSTSRKTSRTEAKNGADNISKIQITNKSLNSVTISWDQPEHPNGIILSYTVEYQRIDIENAKPLRECLTAKDSRNKIIYYSILKLFPGKYKVKISAASSESEDRVYSNYIYFSIEEPASNTLLIVCLVVLIFFAFLCFLGWLYMKHQNEKTNLKLIQTVNPEYVPSVYIPDEWEVARKKIDLLIELGQGSFGMVWEGLAHDIKGKCEVRCAVKTVNEHATNRERLEFLNEASVMKAFDTAHVVKLLGVVSQGQPTLVIMELMANGDLKSYLRLHRPDVENLYTALVKHPPTLKQGLQMAIEIADGMAYLSAKKFVHRDLAARNCMVSEEFTVKIGDFGMTRDIYETDYYRKGTKGLLPVRWMAPESLKDGVFTSSSDVWSYGVVLWEMVTLASQPYQGLSNDQVLRYVIDGGVMERPENCPDKLYTLMRYCWQHKPATRPTFLKLCQLLLDDASPIFPQVSFYHSPAGAVARASRPSPLPIQNNQTIPLRKVTDKLRGYIPSGSQDSDEFDIDTHHQFPKISDRGVVVTTSANGYVSGCPINRTTTMQC